MPPALAIGIPVIDLSGHDFRAGKAASDFPKARIYGEGPLPAKPSESTRRHAQIADRVDNDAGVSYRLIIGEDRIDNVGLDEILDYVSPLDLELFENKKFAEEREILRVVEEDDRREREEMQQLVKAARAKQNAEMRAAVSSESPDDSLDEIDSHHLGADLGSAGLNGRTGRPRPTYKHLYKFSERRRRKRDPVTGELSSLDNNDGDLMSSGEDFVVHFHPRRLSGTSTDLPKRRRRKRDKVTGELLPLSPRQHSIEGGQRPLPPVIDDSEPSKPRPRRRRHPLTNELMPLGWRYDPDEEARGMIQTNQRVRVADQHEAKRLRVDPESLSRSRSPRDGKHAHVQTSVTRPGDVQPHRSQPVDVKPMVIDLVGTSDDSDAVKATKKERRTRSVDHVETLGRRNLASVSTSLKSEHSSDSRLSSDQLGKTSIVRPLANKAAAKTSILNPSAARASSVESIPATSDDMDEGSNDGAEFDIEEIVGHSSSNPKTHPVSLGKQPVMLYRVKWVGYPDPTWEPLESFGDIAIVNEYHAQHGLERLPDEEERDAVASDAHGNIGTSQGKTGSASDAMAANGVIDLTLTDAPDDADEEDEEYEMESIMAHALSDPRTHTPGMGSKAVMLYQVRWRGYDEVTWEPASSFSPDNDILSQYNRQAGIR